MTERLKNRVASLLDSLGAGAFEREEVIGLSLLAALAGKAFSFLEFRALVKVWLPGA